MESLFHKLHSASRIAEDDFDGVKAYFASVRSILNELQGFECDLSSEGSPGCRFVSHIMTDTLPRNFLQEMQRTTNVQYPSIGLLFDSYQATLYNLRKFSDFPEKSASLPSVPKKQSKPKPWQMKTSTFQTAKGEDVKSSSAVSQSKVCKMCSSTEHFMQSCSQYKTPQDRRARCIELGLCAAFSGAQHNTENCPAKKYGLSRPCFLCKSKLHVSALCTASAKAADKSKSKLSDESVPGLSDSSNHQTNWSVNSGHSKADFLLPTISLTFCKGNKSHLVRCLVDLGSQRSYIHSSVLALLGIQLNSIPQFESSIKTFLGSALI